MRIVFSVPRYHPNHDGMVLGLRRAGHQVHFLVRSTNPTEHYGEGVEVTRVPGPGTFRTVEGWSEPAFDAGEQRLPPLAFLRAYLKRVRPDLVIGRNASVLNMALFLLCRAMGIRFLLYGLSPDGYEQLPLQRRLMLRLGLWPAHTINTVSAAPKHDVPGKTYDFIPFAVEPFGDAKSDWATGLPISILAVGKLDQARKNHVPLVRTLGEMLRAGQVRLTLAGLLGETPGPAFQALRDEITLQGVTEAVQMRTNLSYGAARELYGAHDLFVMPSRKEPAGIAPVEAMASGLAVIVGSDCGTRYFVEPGETGFIFEAGDFEQMRGQVQHFVDAPSELRRMGRNALARIETHFTPEIFERNLMRIVENRFGVI